MQTMFVWLLIALYIVAGVLLTTEIYLPNWLYWSVVAYVIVGTGALFYAIWSASQPPKDRPKDDRDLDAG